MEYFRGGTELGRYCTSLTNLSHDELLHIFSFVDSRCRRSVLPSVCRTFLQALKESGGIYESLKVDLRGVKATQPVQLGMHLTDLEFWVRPRAPFVCGLRLQVGDEWQAGCSHAVDSLLQSCVQLQTLHFLVQGRLGLLPRVTGSLTSLRSLRITADSTFERLPCWIRNLSRLEHLEFDCRIEAGTVVITKFLPVEILELVKLRTLTLSHCQRLTIPPQLGDMPALESFRVRDAAVSFHSTAFSPHCFSSRTLTGLELVNCRLDVLPHQVSNMSSLVRLDVSDNRLSALPRLLAAKLSNLQEINLSHNSFLHIPSVLKNLHQLRVIDLSYNEDLQVGGSDCPEKGGIPPVLPVVPNSGRRTTLTQLVSNLHSLVLLDLRCSPAKAWSRDSERQLSVVQQALKQRESWCYLRELRC